MSELERLIQELCPNGVEYVPIWTVTIWDKKFKSVEKHKQANTQRYRYLLSRDLAPLIDSFGDIKILTTYESNLFTNEKKAKGYVSNSEIIAIPWGGNAIVQYYCGRFITSDNRIATSIDKEKLSTKFLYYCMKNKIQEIISFYRGSGIKHPDMSQVLDVKIPIPPLPVQREIVRILDNFTEIGREHV